VFLKSRERLTSQLAGTARSRSPEPAATARRWKSSGSISPRAGTAAVARAQRTGEQAFRQGQRQLPDEVAAAAAKVVKLAPPRLRHWVTGADPTFGGLSPR
jgi:hypothetical protein